MLTEQYAVNEVFTSRTTTVVYLASTYPPLAVISQVHMERVRRLVSFFNAAAMWRAPADPNSQSSRYSAVSEGKCTSARESCSADSASRLLPAVMIINVEGM